MNHAQRDNMDQNTVQSLPPKEMYMIEMECTYELTSRYGPDEHYLSDCDERG